MHTPSKFLKAAFHKFYLVFPEYFDSNVDAVPNQKAYPEATIIVIVKILLLLKVNGVWLLVINIVYTSYLMSWRTT